MQMLNLDGDLFTFTRMNRGHASFSGKVTTLFNNMYTTERLELVKKVVAKRSKEEKLRKKEEMKKERER
ncbi:hypothetical protein L1987_74307 [Smallanthus sonchifolius]|uniref:Uncharacterized protein n=1 Tax=Smallanthus sonchifolius TaxID=185202 RepID=A0ACB9A378_9ASTR|nr:hypothetical protein L1987_74307 [Smallanthus sonchifolius]